MLGGLIAIAVADAYVANMLNQEARINLEQQLSAARQNAEYEIQKKRNENMAQIEKQGAP